MSSRIPRISPFLGRATAFLTLAYLLGLLATMIALRFVGEQWWLTTVLLYVPRAVFFLPAVPLLLASIFVRRPLVIAGSLACLLLAAALAGFQLHWPRKPAANGFSFRIATCNMATGSIAVEGIVSQLRQEGADIILIQEGQEDLYARMTAAAAGYAVVSGGQFWIASRFPILKTYEPPKILFDGVMRSPRFVRYLLKTPRGPLLVYNVHFISPRDGLEELRGEGFAVELRRGNLLSGRGRTVISNNAGLRELQMRTVSADAAKSPYPAIIAGDTNLPSLSWALAHWLGDYNDAFSDAGQGFGYTFPAPRHPWMRIDRVLADQVFRFTSFDVVRKPLSDHFPVIAQVEWPVSN